jgi:hypothetical protein
LLLKAELIQLRVQRLYFSLKFANCLNQSAHISRHIGGRRRGSRLGRFLTAAGGGDQEKADDD